jgi:hypothetical protein
MTRNQKNSKQGRKLKNMETQQKKKKDKHEDKVRDLKPVKDPKGGIPPGPCGPGRQRSPSRMPTAVE